MSDTNHDTDDKPDYIRPGDSEQGDLELLWQTDEPLSLIQSLKKRTGRRHSREWEIISAHLDACLKELEAAQAPTAKAD